MLRRSVAAATGVIVSTPVLAEVARAHNATVRVFPNMVNPLALPAPRPRPRDGVLRIGYAGSMSHNLRLIAPAVGLAAALPVLTAPRGLC